MDAAVAAAMSDPDRNPHFRRRWPQAGAAGESRHREVFAIGALGLALQEALNRRNRAALAQEVARNNSDPPHER